MVDTRPSRAILILSFLTGVLVASPAYGEPRPPPAAPVVNPARPAAPIDVAAEISQLRAALIEEVPHLIVDRPRSKREWIARTGAAIAASGPAFDRPHLLAVVDRNLRIQQVRLILAQPQGDWDDLGGTKVSTGQVGCYDYFLTPTGVFLHTAAVLDWRAEGTFNARHIRGLGERGMRVWDFGWQRAVSGWRSATKVSKMRLLLHATDPNYLAQRLGRVASKGCIRIPEAMNLFLDRHGILDRELRTSRAIQPTVRGCALARPDTDSARRKCARRRRLFAAALT